MMNRDRVIHRCDLIFYSGSGGSNNVLIFKFKFKFAVVCTVRTAARLGILLTTGPNRKIKHSITLGNTYLCSYSIHDQAP